MSARDLDSTKRWCIWGGRGEAWEGIHDSSPGRASDERGAHEQESRYDGTVQPRGWSATSGAMSTRTDLSHENDPVRGFERSAQAGRCTRLTIERCGNVEYGPADEEVLVSEPGERSTGGPFLISPPSPSFPFPPLPPRITTHPALTWHPVRPFSISNTMSSLI